ncbi:hypothetical protein CAPTEDRAFT_219433 [Capitella teleta]|uniref:Peroxisomal membrane protein PEX14 n=1 Tax=Capitella teleta TaxID=283909 RepID=R7VAL6_CAPTE|nr:hypothetical protein CAPTEDRAFT_219433 [Capitella teleta]|eukprot:ELU15644.1 hypothetical protein CAPTEDRAFT_219433 [Capitella teleta]
MDAVARRIHGSSLSRLLRRITHACIVCNTVLAEEEEKAPSPSLRENLIDTAVKFLQNPKVRETTFAQRKTFLENKGLTKDEIDAAIARSGTAGDVHAPPIAPGQMHPQQMLMPSAPPPASGWRKAKDFAATAIVVGGIGYAMFVLYKKYIQPIWFGPSKEEQQMANLNASIRELQASIADTLKVIQDMQGNVTKQSEQIESLVVADSASKGNTEYRKLQESQATNEIKEELKSLKGLLLTRKQFPAAPKPSIPTWQLEAKSEEVKGEETLKEVNAAESPANMEPLANGEQEQASNEDASAE